MLEEGSRYFVAKCDHIRRIYTARDTCIWACPNRQLSPQPKDILSEAFDQGPVMLIFSANNCHGWHGIARMITKPGSSKTEIISECHKSIDDATVSDSKASSDEPQIWHKFQIKWETLFLKEHGEQCLPFTKTEHLTFPDGSLVNKARNLQELPIGIGQQLYGLIDTYHKHLKDIKLKKIEDMKEKLGPPFFDPEYATDPDEVWQQMLMKVESVGKVLIACCFGSQRYNLHTPESDVDMFIVYTAETKDLLGFHPLHHTIKSRDTESYDYTIIEIHRFCELLLSGDPRCVEALFLHPSCVYYVSEEWKGIQKLRTGFLTRQCLEKYLRDATGCKGTKLLDKWDKSGETTTSPMTPRVAKLFYIIIRLLQNAREVPSGHIEVFREEDSSERELLMRVRQCLLDYQTLRRIVNSLLQEVSQAKSTMEEDSAEKQTSIQERLQNWLLKKRYYSFVHYMEPIKDNL